VHCLRFKDQRKGGWHTRHSRHTASQALMPASVHVPLTAAAQAHSLWRSPALPAPCPGLSRAALPHAQRRRHPTRRPAQATHPLTSLFYSSFLLHTLSLILRVYKEKCGQGELGSEARPRPRADSHRHRQTPILGLYLAWLTKCLTAKRLMRCARAGHVSVQCLQLNH